MNVVRSAPLVFSLLALLTTPFTTFAQGDAGVEANFIAMLKNATLKGSWAPIQQGTLGQDKADDSYRIARAEKAGDGTWSIVSRFEMRGREIEYPIRSDVKFAGDTAVLILNNVRAGRGSANWSARVMFHDDVYAGRWWETENPNHGGTIAGTITREHEESETPSAETDGARKDVEPAR